MSRKEIRRTQDLARAAALLSGLEAGSVNLPPEAGKQSAAGFAFLFAGAMTGKERERIQPQSAPKRTICEV
jgi:hypothetical protein